VTFTISSGSGEVAVISDAISCVRAEDNILGFILSRIHVDNHHAGSKFQVVTCNATDRIFYVIAYTKTVNSTNGSVEIPLNQFALSGGQSEYAHAPSTLSSTRETRNGQGGYLDDGETLLSP
jgi:hypothetical protein